MDLFDMLVIPDPEPEPSKAPPVDIMNELGIIIKKHGGSLPATALQEIASIYSDPPPWAPWK